MRSTRPHLPSFLAGTALSALAFVAMAHRPPAGPAFEYKVLRNPSEDDIDTAAEEGWDYAGYLGRSTRGPSIDETLWRRPTQ